jgi:polysaccharide export outer membrane protein
MEVVQSSISEIRDRLSCWSGIVFLIAAALLATGCTDSRGGPIPYDVSDFGSPDSTTIAPLGTDYKIAPMDTLTVTVFRVPDLTGEYSVDLLGKISMPLVGDVAAADRTPEELDRLLTEKLGEKYFVNPDVSVGIKASAGRLVTVDGAVSKAGSYPVLGPLTLMQAVALAGGAEENANLRRVAIFRNIGGRRQAAAFDLVGIRRGEVRDPPVYAGDIVIVDGSSIKDTQKKILQGMPILSIFRPFAL